MDPIRMQAFMSQANAGSPANITQDDRDRIEMALSSLSPQERECYELAYGRGFTFGEIAQMLVIAKSSVQKYVERAQRKVSNELNNNLFLR
jgi:RNA polymerase sigma-70 factor (ECF subfamily)